jgi:hypothetical protein
LLLSLVVLFLSSHNIYGLKIVITFRICDRYLVHLLDSNISFQHIL